MAIDNIDPNELSLQDAAGMQLVHVLRRIIEEINNGGDTPSPTPTEPIGIFWCEYNVTTASEIIAALNNNQLPVIYYDDLVFVLNKVSNNTCCFSSVYFGSMRPAFNYIEVTGSRWAEATDRLQAKLTFDYTPTQGSTNPVTSGGVYTAISNIQIDPQDIADAVDDWLNDHSSSIGGLTFEAKQALMNCFAHVAWIDANGQTYYDALYNALFNTTTLESIYALFTQGSAVIYDTDSLDSLRQYLVVTAYYSDETSAVVTDYTLSGTLTVGTSTITASYGDKSSTFNVTVSQRATLASISAVFNQGSAVVYVTDTLDSLKQYLTVTANYSDSSTATVPSTDYTLSGTLTAGTSTITVSYGGKTDTFTVTVTDAGLYSLVEGTHTYSDGSIVTVSNRNHVKYECKQNCSSATTNNPYFNFSNIQSLGTNQNDNPSTGNQPLFFTIPANSEVVVTIKNLTSTLNAPYNIQFNARKTTGGTTSASRVFSSTLSVTAGTASNTQSFTSAVNVGCFYVFFNTCVENCTYEFDIEVTVNGARYV